METLLDTLSSVAAASGTRTVTLLIVSMAAAVLLVVRFVRAFLVSVVQA